MGDEFLWRFARGAGRTGFAVTLAEAFALEVVSKIGRDMSS